MDLNELGDAISQLTQADLGTADDQMTDKCKSLSSGLKVARIKLTQNMLHRFSSDFDLFSFYFNADFLNSVTKQSLAKLQSSV